MSTDSFTTTQAPPRGRRRLLAGLAAGAALVIAVGAVVTVDRGSSPEPVTTSPASSDTVPATTPVTVGTAGPSLSESIPSAPPGPIGPPSGVAAPDPELPPAPMEHSHDDPGELEHKGSDAPAGDDDHDH